MGQKPYSYYDTLPSKFDDEDVLDQIKFHVSRNNEKEPKHKAKKKVFNPFSLLLLDRSLGPSLWMKRATYNKKIKEGKEDQVTDQERLLFESKVNKKRGFFERLNPTHLIPRDKEKEVDVMADIATGAVTGPPLAVKSLAELLTIGVDMKLDTDFTERLDGLTREFLEYSGEPETLAGEITQLTTQFLVPLKIADKIIGNIPRAIKWFKGRTLFMNNA